MLSTLAMFVTGIAILLARRRRRRATHDARRHARPRPRHALLRHRLRARDRGRVPAARARSAASCDRGRGPDRRSTPGTSAATSRRTRRWTPPTSRRCGSTGSIGPPTASTRRVPRLRVVNLQVLVALALHRGRRVRSSSSAVKHLATHARRRPGASCALVIAPIATELPEKFNSRHLGPPGQGHPGDGQHHRRDGLPGDHPDSRRAGVRLGHVVRRRGDATWSSRRPGSPSCRRGAIFIPMARRGGCTARTCWSAARSTWPTWRW